jgi:alpha-tubulin suppressor-like RCC1 family protein
VTKIACGFRHTLAITSEGKLLGWGFNSMQQLSNADEYQDPDNPKHAIFSPTVLSGPNLEGKFVVDIAAGEEHSVVICHSKKLGRTVKE